MEQFKFTSMPTVSNQQSGFMLPDALPQTNTGFDKGFWFGDKNQAGAFSTGLNAINTGVNAYVGLQQLGLARQQLQFSKDAFNKNYENQTKMINTQLRDRARARYAANPNAYQNPDEYMDKNRVGG